MGTKSNGDLGHSAKLIKELRERPNFALSYGKKDFPIYLPKLGGRVHMGESNRALDRVALQNCQVDHIYKTLCPVDPPRPVQLTTHQATYPRAAHSPKLEIAPRPPDTMQAVLQSDKEEPKWNSTCQAAYMPHAQKAEALRPTLDLRTIKYSSVSLSMHLHLAIGPNKVPVVGTESAIAGPEKEKEKEKRPEYPRVHNLKQAIERRKDTIIKQGCRESYSAGERDGDV